MTRRVAVTGAAGFLGSHVVEELLREGCAVTGIVRREGAGRGRSWAANPLYRERLLDLNTTEACDGAFEDCDAIVHCAASVTADARRGSKAWGETLRANIGGTEAVLRGVQRAPRVHALIHTSSMAAVLSPRRPRGHRFDETDWNDEPLESSDPYWFSKTAAERLLTDALPQGAGVAGCRLACISPSVIIGPAREERHAGLSLAIMGDLYSGRTPACPDLSFHFVDVRDVAHVHVRAALDENVRGRFLLPGNEARMIEVAEVIRRRFPESRAPRHGAPDWLMYVAAAFTRRVSFRYLRRNLGLRYRFDDIRTRTTFGIEYRPLEETIVDSIRALLELARREGRDL